MASNPAIQFNDTPDNQLVNNPQNNLDIDFDDVHVDGTFDLDKFNKKYNDVRKRRKQKIINSEAERLARLNEIRYKKKIHELTVGELFFNLKDAMFDTLTDFLYLRFKIDNNRLFYIGLMIIIITSIVFVFTSTSCQKPVCKKPNYLVLSDYEPNDTI